VVQLAANEQRPAQARANGEKDHCRQALRRAKPCFAHRQSIDIVVCKRRHAQALRECRLYINACPAGQQVCGGKDNAAHRVNLPARANADRLYLRARPQRMSQREGGCQDARPALLRRCGNVCAATNTALRSDNRPGNLGAANVYAQKVSHANSLCSCYTDCVRWNVSYLGVDVGCFKWDAKRAVIC